MRPTRLIYVENDPALRGIMTTLLDEVDELDVILSTGIDTVARTVPKAALIGWSTFPKSGDLAMDELVEVVRQSARGRSSIDASHAEASPLDALTCASPPSWGWPPRVWTPPRSIYAR